MNFTYKKIYFYLYLFILVFFALPVVKISGARIEQLLLVLTFCILFVEDIYRHELDFKLLFFLVGGAVVMVLISLNSTYPKIDEIKYFIKFLFIYPTTYYIGSRVLTRVSIKEFLNIIDLTLLFYVISWFTVMYIPLPHSILEKIIHFRDFGFGKEFLPYQGTFYEAGALGVIVGTVFLFSVLGHYEFDKNYKEKKHIFLLQFLTVYIMFLSKNKTVWLSYTLILFFLVFYKWYLILRHSSYYTPISKLKNDLILKKFLKINTMYLLGGSILIIGIFFIYNTLSPNPFITMQEFQYKLHHERGAQFLAAWELIEKSHYLGGYGWGFVEPYFNNLNIMGVGKGAGSINSVFLDAWLQGSVFAVFYLGAIIYISFDNKSFLTIAVPMYLLFFGLTNPIVAEEYFLFLGISYSFKRYFETKEKYD